jgi:hypothetical protein
LIDHRCVPPLDVCSKENRGTEYSKEERNQAAILGTTLLQPESGQHFRRALEHDCSALLPDSQRCKKERDEPILPPRQPIVGMASHLKEEVAVAAFVQEAARGWPLYRQSAENERSRGEASDLGTCTAIGSDDFDCLCPSKTAFRKAQIHTVLFQNRPGRLEIL